MTFVKNTAYFFEIIKKNNKIRKIIENYDGEFDGFFENINDENERDDVIDYLKNRGYISIGKFEGYIRYKRRNYYNIKNFKVNKKCNIDLLTDNKNDF